MANKVENPYNDSLKIFQCYSKKLVERSLIELSTNVPVEPRALNLSIELPVLKSPTSVAMEEFSQQLVQKLLDSQLIADARSNWVHRLDEPETPLSVQSPDEPLTPGSGKPLGEPEAVVVKRVAIIGGGVAGLSAAMQLSGNYGFEVDVIEANDRLGGRLYTHRFSDDEGAPYGEWDYFDVGAMRFPKTPVMDRTFALFEELKKLGLELLDYHISNDNNWQAYNNVRLQVKNLKHAGPDPFKVAALPASPGLPAGRPGLPPYWANQNPSDLLRAAIQPFLCALAEDYDGVLDVLISCFDHFSTRSYLSTIMNYPPDVINWIETMSFGTGWFDRALIETILEELAFSFNKKSPKDLEWHCVKHGSRVIPEKMEEWLKKNSTNTKIKKQHRVTAVQFNGTEFELFGNTPKNPTGTPGSFGQKYTHIIFALPPPCIRMIDISTCELDFNQRNALRELQLAPSSKIGIKFKTAWWKKQGIIGGQSTTDRVCRTVVYPSHGEGESTVLIASYSWAQDSLALGAMMHGPHSPEKARLKQLMLADLAYIHGVSIEELEEEYEDMKAFDWNHNSLSMGAFGLFGPSQFANTFPALTRTATRGRMHFIGETFSTTHGWVAGALESAERAVSLMLKLHSQALKSQAPENEEVVEDPFEAYTNQWQGRQLMVDDDTLLRQHLRSWILQKREFQF